MDDPIGDAFRNHPKLIAVGGLILFVSACGMVNQATQPTRSSSVQQAQVATQPGPQGTARAENGRLLRISGDHINSQEYGPALSAAQTAVAIIPDPTVRAVLPTMEAMATQAAAPRPTATPTVAEETKAKAVELLGAAAHQKEVGQLGLALELTSQSIAAWKDYPDAKTFQAELIPQATAQAKDAQAQATAAAEQAKVQATAQAKAAAEAASKAAAQADANRATEQRTAYLNLLRAAGVDRSLIVGVDRGRDDNELRITVANTWHYQPHQIRLQAAQNLWGVWAKLRSPDNLDHARIKLLDQNGNDVGGSGWLAGSMVNVKK